MLWDECLLQKKGDGPSCVVYFRDPGARTRECGWSRVRCSGVLAQKCTEPLDLEDEKWF